MTGIIQRWKENDKYIIYRRCGDIKNLNGGKAKRYFEVSKETMQATGREFTSKAQIN